MGGVDRLRKRCRRLKRKLRVLEKEFLWREIEWFRVSEAHQYRTDDTGAESGDPPGGAYSMNNVSGAGATGLSPHHRPQ